MELLYGILFLQILFHCSQGRPDGAPRSACATLAPEHGTPAQSGTPPYTVSAVNSGDKVRVVISSPYGEKLQGFVIQARSSRDRNRMVDGTFTQTREISKAIDCFNGRQNTLTQVNPNPKSEIITEWTPASGVNEEVVFRATVAKTFYEFWTEMDSAPVRVRGIAGRSGSSSGSTSGSRPRQNEDGHMHSMYDNCYITKGCFGFPANCVDQKNCEVFVVYAKKDDGISFKMTGLLKEGSYMAVGLSTDTLMGDDSVTDCYIQNGRINARESWNNRRDNEPIREIPEGFYEGVSNNGLTSCSWTKEYKTEVKGKIFDIANFAYYLLVAKGPLRQDGRIDRHTGRIWTQQDVNLTAFNYIESEGSTSSVKIHGTFMLTAWIGLVSLAILLARHFKSAWENRTIFGVKVWFAFHRGLMVVALLFVVVAFIVIFVHKEGWDYDGRNPHAVLGCIATALGLFQPIMAAFRPSPDHSKRPLFNWLHWAVGNSAQIIAVVTIFYAVSLEASGLKESFYWVMAVFVIVHCIFHFLFQFHTWTAEKMKNNEVKMLEMSSGRTHSTMQTNNVQDKNLSGNVFRVLLLGIYGIFLAVIMMALYALVAVA